jgi:hypothetical protein
MSWLPFNSAQPLLVVLKDVFNALKDGAGASFKAPQPVSDLPERSDARAAETD